LFFSDFGLVFVALLVVAQKRGKMAKIFGVVRKISWWARFRFAHPTA